MKMCEDVSAIRSSRTDHFGAKESSRTAHFCAKELLNFLVNPFFLSKSVTLQEHFRNVVSARFYSGSQQMSVRTIKTGIDPKTDKSAAV